MKRIGVIIFIFFIIALLVALFVSRRQQSTKQDTPAAQPSPTLPPPLPQPTFPTDSLLPSPSYVMGTIADTFPKSLPVFIPQPGPTIQKEAERLASIFTISAAPTISTDPDGAVYYMWSADPGLIVGPNAQHVNYSRTAPTTNPLLPPDSIFTSLGQQLASKVLPGYQTKLTSTLYYAPQVTDLNFVPRTTATAIQLTYLPVLGGIPLVAGAPKNSETTIRYNAAQTLLYYSGYIYPQFKESGQAPIISLQEAGARLVAGKGGVVYAFSQADLNAHDTKWYQFSLASVVGAELAYYYDFKRKQLAPVFLFTSTAVDKTTGNKVDVVSAVSAIP